MLQYLWLIPVGFGVGACGTLIGAGGGFVLMPILLLAYPTDSPALLTSISLAVVFFNAASGSWAYHRMGRIDYKSGWLFCAGTVPGAILGAFTAEYIPRQEFNTIFGLLMLVASAYLFFHPDKKKTGKIIVGESLSEPGETHNGNGQFSYNRALGVVLSVGVGYVSSLLGVGGGFIHVPLLVRLLNFPVHVATATSHFILAITAFTGSLVHVASGALSGGLWQTALLTIGVLPGAQLGAQLSSRVSGDWIIRGLALALALVGLRILLTAL